MTEEHANQDYLPVQFDVAFGPFLGTRRSIRLDGGQLVCKVSLWRRVRVCPSEEAWRAFWQEMESLRLWQWSATYRPAPDTVFYDGARWSIAITHGERRVASEGSNAYPGNSKKHIMETRASSTGSARESERFRKFRQALQRLTGVESFG